MCWRGGRVVDCGGLENRYPGNGIGGSNPSPSAKKLVNDFVKLFIWVVVVGVTFAILWRKGYLMRLSNYILETREELRKCTWPSFDELKGSTVVVMVTIFILGLFTVGVDYVISKLIQLIT